MYAKALFLLLSTTFMITGAIFGDLMQDPAWFQFLYGMAIVANIHFLVTECCELTDIAKADRKCHCK